jgi:uncharacterized protein
MVIGVATVRLLLPEAASLKDKRRVVKSVTARMRSRFNVAIAEVDDHDAWGTVTLGIVCVSTVGGHAHAMLEQVVQAIADERLDADLAGYEIELL